MFCRLQMHVSGEGALGVLYHADPCGKNTTAGVVLDSEQPDPQRPPEEMALLSVHYEHIAQEAYTCAYLIAAVSSVTPSPFAP